MSLTINQTVTFPDTKGSTLEGTVHKMNPKKCQVKLTKGNHRFQAGIIINVPYWLLGTGDYGQGVVAPRVPVVAAPFAPSEWWVREHAHELMILDGLYGELSPENLCCDGEASHSYIVQKRRDVERRMQAVFILLGTQISEDTHYDIMEKYRKTIVESLKRDVARHDRFSAMATP